MKEIKCKICGKEVQVENLSVRFYAKWIEIEPGIWVCRECERSAIWPNIIQYKLPDDYRS